MNAHNQFNELSVVVARLVKHEAFGFCGAVDSASKNLWCKCGPECYVNCNIKFEK